MKLAVISHLHPGSSPNALLKSSSNRRMTHPFGQQERPEKDMQLPMSERCPLLYVNGQNNHPYNYSRNYRPGFQNGQFTSYPYAQPSQQQVDRRLPPPDIYPPYPILLFGGDYAMHSLLLLPPSSEIFSSLLHHARKARAASAHISPKDIVEHAINRSQTLTYISNGPSGEIWLLEKGREEVLACLVLEIEGSWELLGVGTDGSQGEVFLRHSSCQVESNNVEVQKNNDYAGPPLEWSTRPETKVEEMMNSNIPARRSQGEKKKPPEQVVKIRNHRKLDRTSLGRIKALNKWKAFWAQKCNLL